MTNTDVILIAIIAILGSSAGVWVVVRKINQYSPAPGNVLTRRGDIELNNFIEPTQPLPVYYPRGYSEPTNLIGSNPLDTINLIGSNPLDTITVIEGLNSDHINSISTVVSPLDSDVESLDYDSLNLEPINYNIQDIFINSILENEYNLYYLISTITILLFIIITYNIYRNKPAITFFNKNYVNK